jgi:hypothetical protein
MMPVLANARHERFAQLVASGKNGAEAHVLAGYSRGGAKQSARRLLTHAYLQRRIEELQSVIADGIVKLAVTDRNARLTALQERQDALRSIVKARAADPSNQSAPGANTGYMVRNIKQIGGGDTAQVVEEFVLDTGLLRELREIEKQAAIECGDWFEHEKAPPVAGPSATVQVGRPDLRRLGTERLKALLAIIQGVERGSVVEGSVRDVGSTPDSVA